MLREKRNIHFVGVGGIGMSGIAQVLIEMGHTVSGSDAEKSHITKRLEAMGGLMKEGHRRENLPKETDMLVYSSSIKRDNPEMCEARKRRIKIVHRAQMLGAIFNDKLGIAISGTHGKTTTTSLISVMLENLGMDPTVIIGGEVGLFNGNAKFGNGDFSVAEADESDSSFLHLKPLYEIITNIEMEHLDHFKSLEHIRETYKKFINNSKPGACIFYNKDDLNIRIVMKDIGRKSESFGFSKEADMYPVDIRMEGFKTSYTCVYRNKVLGRVNLNIPGRHNILNSMAAILVGIKIGIAFKDITHAIKDFDGAKRRFQLRADCRDVMLIEDYAHHPTEIRAVLDACRNWKDKRIIAVFQPHRYSRTKLLADEFGKCFKDVDKLILTDIYSASEKLIKGVSENTIYEKARLNGVEDIKLMHKESVPDYIMKIKRAGDMILILGAGDIKNIANRLSEMMRGEEEPPIRYSSDKRLMAKLRKAVKGKIKVGEKLSGRTSFKIGGESDIWIEPADIKDLQRVLKFVKEYKIPMFIIGNGSNILAGDRGFSGILLHLGSEFFKKITIKGSNIIVRSGFSLPRLVRLSCENGLGGMESLVGIPGTIGGAIFMNAGGHKNPAYRNIGELIVSLKVMDYEGKVKILKSAELIFNYRSSNLDPYIIIEAKLKLDKRDKSGLVSSMGRFLKLKKDKQVLDWPSAGCVFKNPVDFQFTSGQIIDMLKLKGKRIGGAEISEKHGNFIINRGQAKCSDVLALIDMVRKKVKENYGIELETEVKIL